MIKRILIAILVIIIVTCTSFIYIYFIPNQTISKIKFQDDSLEISENFDNFKIIAFSDLKIKNESDLIELNDLVNLINDQEPNLVVFLGDVFAETSNINDNLIEQITDSLSSIQAKSGKFAVLGEVDLLAIEKIYPLLFDSEFEILEDKSLKIFNGSNDYINLIGMSISSSGNYNTQTAFTNVNKTAYTITLCHYPNLFSKIEGKTNLFLAGHTLGGERVLPFIGPNKAIEGTDQYYNGIVTDNNATMIISNGIGENEDYRILAEKNIIVVTLKHKDKNSTINTQE